MQFRKGEVYHALCLLAWSRLLSSVCIPEERAGNKVKALVLKTLLATFNEPISKLIRIMSCP